MKIQTFSLLFLITAVSPTAAEEAGTLEPRTPAAEAAGKVGKDAVVSGMLTQLTKREKLWYLNIDGNYPTNAFTAVVFAKNFNVFTNVDAMVGKKIEITGKVAEFQGKPQIVLERAGQMALPKP